MPHFETERRIIGNQIRHRLETIYQAMILDHEPVGNWKICVTGTKQGPNQKPSDSGFKPFNIPSVWGGLDILTWFKTEKMVPKRFAGRGVRLRIRPGGESLCFVNGVPTQGLDHNRDEILLTEKAKGGEKFTFLIEALSHPRFKETATFEYAELVVTDKRVWDFYWDAKVVYDVTQIMPENSADRIRLFDLVDHCVKGVDLQHIGARQFFDSMARSKKELQDGLKQFRNRGDLGSLLLCGHSHIDTAWLWPLRETMRKCGRTFSTVLKYMEQYPEYHFSQSQPQLYEYTMKHYPELYAGIKKRVKEGRWEPVSAGWVEHDSNVTSGESLVRQFLYGNRFFRREFGIHTRTCWLPDAFGFTWALPQILVKAGVDTFVTTKISWSQYTEFPYSLFHWQGIDGTRILAMMPPLNYNGNVVPRDCKAQWDLFKQKDQVDEVLFSFGHGDGGGGPTTAMIENGIRMADIAGVPRQEFGRIQDYYDRIKEKIDIEKLPVWNGELYLELHRACQTTQSRTKRNNRLCELSFHDAEFFGAVAEKLGAPFPREQALDAWKVTLTNQFHDILPGSSIHEVYQDTDHDYAEVLDTVHGIRDKSFQVILNKIDTSGNGEPIVAANTLSWERSDVAALECKIPGGSFVIADDKGAEVPFQVVTDIDGKKKILFEALNVPALGWKVFRLIKGKKSKAENKLSASAGKITTPKFAMTLNRMGQITKLTDKVMNREVIPSGQAGNDLQFFDDRPHGGDAWDVDFNYMEKMWRIKEVESMEVLESGPVRARIRIKMKTEKSTLVQDIMAYNVVDRIDFATQADWWEKRVLLKVAFPVEVLSPRAAYEIQFGAIERPTHWNTPWDRARFEVAGQKWVDLSEGDYGVSLLNDCKYGHDVHENVLRLSLLRSSIDPDTNADEGRHQFTYSLYPHSGDWRQGGTVRNGYGLNCPLMAALAPSSKAAASSSKGSLPKVFSLASIDRDNVVIDTVKPAEDSKDVIVRLYEAHGCRGPVKISFGLAPKAVFECDLMEENDQPVKLTGDSVILNIKPFELRTLKLKW